MNAPYNVFSLSLLYIYIVGWVNLLSLKILQGRLNMCGRFNLACSNGDIEKIVVGLQGTFTNLPNYNFCPSQNIPVLIKKASVILTAMHWGIELESKNYEHTRQMFNTRCESLLENKFGDSFYNRLCLIPATGFFEWKHQTNLRNGSAEPFNVRVLNNDLFFMAGLHSKFLNDGAVSIITREATNVMKDIHGRMPLILSAEQINEWLDMQFSHNREEKLKEIITSHERHIINAHRVSSFVNSTANNSINCVTEIKDRQIRLI
jgi:putative SOS response-associated peptidase YedK